MTSVFFFLHQRPIRAKWGRVVCGWAGVPEGYLSPEGLSAGLSLGGEVSREEGGRSKLWTQGDITAKLYEVSSPAPSIVHRRAWSWDTQPRSWQQGGENEALRAAVGAGKGGRGRAEEGIMEGKFPDKLLCIFWFRFWHAEGNALCFLKEVQISPLHPF